MKALPNINVFATCLLPEILIMTSIFAAEDRELS